MLLDKEADRNLSHSPAQIAVKGQG